MSEPIITIITPCYNASQYIAATIDSVINQTFTDWELIIIDDGSKDNSIVIIEKYQKKYPNICLFKKNNAGSSDSRNFGIKIANGRFYAFLDADDIWHKDYLETMLKNIDSCDVDNAAIYFSGYSRMNSSCTKRALSDFSVKGVKTKKDLLRNCPIFPSAAIVDSEKLKENVFFRSELKSLRDDYVYWLDIMEQGLVAYGFDDILVDYRMRDDSMTASKLKMIKPQYLVYRKVCKLCIIKSLYYLVCWGLNGIIKYIK